MVEAHIPGEEVARERYGTCLAPRQHVNCRQVEPESPTDAASTDTDANDAGDDQKG